MPARRYVDLSDEQRAALEPMARMLRANGVEPVAIFYGPGCSGIRRRARQAKALRHKRARAAETLIQP